MCYNLIGVWFIVDMLRRGVVRRLIATLYLYKSDSNRQNEFDQSKISNYDGQYVEELESKIFWSLFYQISKFYIYLLCY